MWEVDWWMRQVVKDWGSEENANDGHLKQMRCSWSVQCIWPIYHWTSERGISGRWMMDWEKWGEWCGEGSAAVARLVSWLRDERAEWRFYGGGKDRRIGLRTKRRIIYRFNNQISQNCTCTYCTCRLFCMWWRLILANHRITFKEIPGTLHPVDHLN